MANLESIKQFATNSSSPASPPSPSSPISPSFVPSGSAAFTSKLSPKFHQLFDDADGFVCVIDARNIITPVVTTNSTTGASTGTTAALNVSRRTSPSFIPSPASTIYPLFNFRSFFQMRCRKEHLGRGTLGPVQKLSFIAFEDEGRSIIGSSPNKRRRKYVYAGWIERTFPAQINHLNTPVEVTRKQI